MASKSISQEPSQFRSTDPLRTDFSSLNVELDDFLFRCEELEFEDRSSDRLSNLYLDTFMSVLPQNRLTTKQKKTTMYLKLFCNFLLKAIVAAFNTDRAFYHLISLSFSLKHISIDYKLCNQLSKIIKPIQFRLGMDWSYKPDNFEADFDDFTLLLTQKLTGLVPSVAVSQTFSSTLHSHYSISFERSSDQGVIRVKPLPQGFLVVEPNFIQLRSGPLTTPPTADRMRELALSTLSHSSIVFQPVQQPRLSLVFGDEIVLPKEFSFETNGEEHKARHSETAMTNISDIISEFVTRCLQSPNTLRLNIGVDDSLSVTVGLILDPTALQNSLSSGLDLLRNYWPPVPPTTFALILQPIVPNPSQCSTVSVSVSVSPRWGSFKNAVQQLQDLQGQAYLYQRSAQPQSKQSGQEFMVSPDPTLADDNFCTILHRYVLTCTFSPPPEYFGVLFVNTRSCPSQWGQHKEPEKLSAFATLQRFRLTASPRIVSELRNPISSKVILWTRKLPLMLPPGTTESIYFLDKPFDQSTRWLIWASSSLRVSQSWMFVSVLVEEGDLRLIEALERLVSSLSHISDPIELFVIASSLSLFDRFTSIFYNHHHLPLRFSICDFWLQSQPIDESNVIPAYQSGASLDEIKNHAIEWLFTGQQWSDALYFNGFCPTWAIHASWIRTIEEYFSSSSPDPQRAQVHTIDKTSRSCGTTTLLCIIKAHMSQFHSRIYVCYQRGSDLHLNFVKDHPTLLLLDDLDEPLKLTTQPTNLLFVLQVVASHNDSMNLIVERDSLPHVCNITTTLFPSKSGIITQYQQMAQASKKPHTRHIFLLLASVANDRVFLKLSDFVDCELSKISLSPDLGEFLKFVAFKSLFAVGSRRYSDASSWVDHQDFKRLCRPCSLLHFKPITSKVTFWHGFMAERILRVYPWSIPHSAESLLSELERIALTETLPRDLPACLMEFLSVKGKSPFLAKIAFLNSNSQTHDKRQIIEAFESFVSKFSLKLKQNPELEFHFLIAKSRLQRRLHFQYEGLFYLHPKQV